MKMSVLNAVPNLMRSVSTANTSPMAAASIGANTTQMKLFLIAVRVASSVEHLAVVVDAGEVATVVEEAARRP